MALGIILSIPQSIRTSIIIYLTLLPLRVNSCPWKEVKEWPQFFFFLKSFPFEVLKGEKAYSVSRVVLMAPPVTDTLSQTSLNVLGLPALMVQDG